MRTKLFATLLLTATSNAFAAGSALTPAGGLYNYTETGFCTADTAIALPAGYPSQYNHVQIGQHSSNPDTTRTFANWVTYAMGVKVGMTNPTSLLTTSLDPSSKTIPQATLTETPIQWGVSGTGANAPIDSELAFTAPYTAKTVFDTSSSVNQFSFVTSFTYSTPANLNGRTTGNAVYVYTGGAWQRQLAYITTSSIVIENNHDEIKTVGTTPYTFHCVSHSHLTK